MCPLCILPLCPPLLLMPTHFSRCPFPCLSLCPSISNCTNHLSWCHYIFDYTPLFLFLCISVCYPVFLTRPLTSDLLLHFLPCFSFSNCAPFLAVPPSLFMPHALTIYTFRKMNCKIIVGLEEGGQTTFVAQGAEGTSYSSGRLLHSAIRLYSPGGIQVPVSTLTLWKRLLLQVKSIITTKVAAAVSQCRAQMILTVHR